MADIPVTLTDIGSLSDYERSLSASGAGGQTGSNTMSVTLPANYGDVIIRQAVCLLIVVTPDTLANDFGRGCEYGIIDPSGSFFAHLGASIWNYSTARTRAVASFIARPTDKVLWAAQNRFFFYLEDLSAAGSYTPYCFFRVERLRVS